MAIGNPFGLGGTVTVGIVSARNRDINSGPYDDSSRPTPPSTAAIPAARCSTWTARSSASTRRSSRRPAARSASASRSRPTARSPVVDQLRQFGETRRGWLGVRIQAVTDDIAESLGMRPGEGRAGGRRRRQAARPSTAGIEPATSSSSSTASTSMRCATCRASSPTRRSARRSTSSSCARAVEQTLKVTLGRLEDGEKVAAIDKEGRHARAVGGAKDLGVGTVESQCRDAQEVQDQGCGRGRYSTGVDPGAASDVPISISGPAMRSSRCVSGRRHARRSAKACQSSTSKARARR